MSLPSRHTISLFSGHDRDYKDRTNLPTSQERDGAAYHLQTSMGSTSHIASEYASVEFSP